ncbi:hypothetical protein HYH03_001230 [Edaphochlamys debaryana]|uniref:FAD-binding domain-containing protein n=1 Tax=Edaphochlamys debaryana TaxID=47281 RepID=A0A836C6R8_9CHLO|nr:hypothetical protein HYH03_001230 [Edaphochlamys debaryana]|eukprot:KAG2501448.1 hypothetical protein HYH03_001230 [Edaphochlamys debaryana]
MNLSAANTAAAPRASASAASRHVAASATQPAASTNGAPEHVDVAIVGGGPAGLLAAKGIQQALPRKTVRVLEAASGYWPQGAGVLIDVNGWRALHAVDDDLAEKMRARGFLFGVTRLYDWAGKSKESQYVSGAWNHEENLRVHGHTSVMVHWGDIRQTLYEALPPGTVAFNSRTVGVTPGRAGGEPATLQLQDAKTGEAHALTAGLVVACDGYFSRVKRQLWNGEGLPAFHDKLIWRAVVEYGSPEDVPPLLVESGGDPLLWLGDGFPPDRSSTAYAVVPGKRYVWTCIASTSFLKEKGMGWATRDAGDAGIHQTGTSGACPKERCLAVFADYPPELRDLIARTDPRAVSEHGYYMHDYDKLQGAPDWVRGNVVLIGDAAHTAPPDGMGLNMAWEDAAVLAATLQARGVTTEALQAYAEARLPRVLDVWQRPPGVANPPRRRAAVAAASFVPLAGAAASGRSMPPPPPAAAEPIVGVPEVTEPVVVASAGPDNAPKAATAAAPATAAPA